MSARLRITSHVVLELEDSRLDFGNLRVPRFATVAGDYDMITRQVAVSTTAEVWDIADSYLSDFDWMFIRTDFDLDVEFIVDDNGTYGEVAFTLPLEGTGTADEFGPLLMIHGDTSYANNTVGFAGTADVIERVQVKNASGTNVAKLQLLVIS